MKLKKPLREKKPKGPVGRKKELGGPRVNFFPGEKLLLAIARLEERRKKLRLPYAFNRSYTFRRGSWMLIRFINALLEKAEQGDAASKKRAGLFGQKLKKYEAKKVTEN